MRIFRVLLSLLLSLAVPAFGNAGSKIAASPCRTEMPGVAQMVSADTAQHADCCHEPARSSQTGEPCKSGDQCHGGHALQHVAAMSHSIPATRSDAVRVEEPVHLGLTARFVWRPPRLL
jgi:hypothetical protein